jgi:hypothetical protein
VRDALVAKFVADGYDVRKLEREIVTSVLYTQAAARLPAEQATDPIWAFGPTKPLYGEAWLDTLGQATGKQLGGCDFRFSIQSSYVNPAKLSFPVSAGVSASFYLGAATPLGGCPAASAHSDPTGLVAALSRRTTLAAICPNAFPTQASNDAQLALEFAGIGRDPTTDEKTRAVGYMNGCDATQDTCTPRGIADALCTSLYASALYTFY